MKNVVKFRKLFVLSASVSLAAAFLGLANFGHAAAVTVPDFSFEYPVTSGWQDNGGLGIAGRWVVPDTGNAWYYLGGYYASWGGSAVGVQNALANGGMTAPDGTQDGYVNNGGWMSSSNLTTILPNRTYTLTVAEGRRGGGFAQSLGFTLALAYGSSPDPSLTNSASWLASLHVDLAGSPPEGTFGDYSIFSITGSSGPAIGQSLFVLLGSDLNGNVNPICYDNVRLDMVPEPSTIALVAGGLGLLALRRRK